MFIPANPNPFKLPDGETSYDYLSMPCFWGNTHPLASTFDAIVALDEFDETYTKVTHLAYTVYYDLYVNNADNIAHWDIRDRLAPLLPIFGEGEESASESILNAFEDVLESVDVEKTTVLNIDKTKFLMEVFLGEVVYAVDQLIKLRDAK